LLHQVAKRKVALAVTGALVASGLLASSALAAPTGSITIGPRISTGQLTAQFYSTSDQYDPTYGYGLSWFPNATLAAPGEQARRPRQAALAGGRLRCGREAAEPILELRDVRHPGAPWAHDAEREQLARCGRLPIAATPALAVRASRIGPETRLTTQWRDRHRPIGRCWGVGGSAGRPGRSARSGRAVVNRDEPRSNAAAISEAQARSHPGALPRAPVDGHLHLSIHAPRWRRCRSSLCRFAAGSVAASAVNRGAIRGPRAAREPTARLPTSQRRRAAIPTQDAR
jgi:hypothetical protein